MPYLDELEILGEWLPYPHVWLHGFPNNTIFLLRCSICVHVCVVIGNTPGDKQWKYLRLSDGKVRRLCGTKKKINCKALVLHTPPNNLQNI